MADDDQIVNFRPMVIIEFSSTVNEDTVQWLVNRITSPKTEDGAELLARIQRNTDESNSSGDGTILQIGATTDQLIDATELTGIRKRTKYGTIKEFRMDDVDDFENTEDLDAFLMPSEKQRLIRGSLDNLRALASECRIVGVSNEMRLYPGQPIVKRMMKEKLIVQMFPLHDRPDLKRLEFEWYAAAFWKTEPIEKVHRYLGQTVAMYFAFLHHYTMALMPPALIAFLYILFNIDTVYNQAFFSVFNMIWVTLFLEKWKRKSSEYAYRWGTINMIEWEQPRAEYHGEMGVNDVTGEKEPIYSTTKRTFRFYCVSLPVICICLTAAVVVFLIYDYFYVMLRVISEQSKDDLVWCTIMPLLPSAIYGFAIALMNQAYRPIAVTLNDWENYRLQSSYDNQLIIKLVMFDSVNSFVSLFHIAFIKQDLNQLRTTLAALLITYQILGQIQEVVIPYIQQRLQSKLIDKMTTVREPDREGLARLKKLCDYRQWLDIGKGFITDEEEDGKQIDLERHLPCSQGVIEDYTEMFIQFGYVFLFSSVFPPAAIWAFLNNITEIKTDAFKFCRTFQRPFAKPTAGIGAWLMAFETIGIIAVMTNCALIALSPYVKENMAHYGPINVIFIFVAAEHVILLTKFVLAVAIPDVPDWVQTALKRQQYNADQSFKKLTSVNSLRRRLTTKLKQKPPKHETTL